MTSKRQSVYHIEVSASQAGRRMDNFLFSELKNIPKSKVYKIIRKGEVRVNGKRISSQYRLQEGDSVRIPPLHHEMSALSPQSVPTDWVEPAILYQDADILAINKPAGMAVHAGSKTRFGVIDCVQAAFPDLPELQLVHRLDKDTSGCLLLAKDHRALRECQAVLQTDAVVKRYQCLVRGRWPYPHHMVCDPLIRQTDKVVVATDPKVRDAKAAKTEFQRLEQYRDYTLLEARLHTGRTHQIRVHTSHLGYPIIGDDKYGDFAANRKADKLGLKRLFLHAVSLNFHLDYNQQTYSFVAPLTADLADFLTELT